MTLQCLHRLLPILLLTGTAQTFIHASAAANEFDLPQLASAEAEIAEVAEENASQADESGDRWGKFLPLPIFVTEPAIGEGLGAALIYFHQDDDRQKSKLSTAQEISKTGERSKPPPTATGIFGFYTNSDTAALGVGHSRTFDNDQYRLRAALIDARINSDYYIGDRAVGFQMEGSALFADLKTRLGDTGMFFGISTSYANADNIFRENSTEIDGISLEDFAFIDAGIAASLIYDTRDNTILPADGFLVELIGWRYSEDLGGDFDYNSSRLKALWFKQFGKDYVLGLRADVGEANGEVPFFAAPYVRLRGIPALRYQGEVAGAFEIEARRRIADRWTVSLFGGVGSVKVGDEQTETRDDIRTIGVGARFLALREQDAWVGLDIAQGPEDVAWYIQVGSPW